MVAKVILNPYSNRWRSKERWPEAESALKEAGVKFEHIVSQHKGQVVGLVEAAARAGFSPIIAAGGDGTIGEAVNGMARAATSDQIPLGPLGVMPLGSANDLVINLGLPTELRAAARIIAAGNMRLMDVGKLNERYFVNNSAMGLEATVTIKHERIQWIKGIVRYLVAAIWAIMERPEWMGQIKWDSGEYNGPLSLASIGNAPRTGGLYMTPHADPFDGKLTCAFGHRKNRIALLQALPRAMRPDEGNYVELDDVMEIHTTELSIYLDRPSPAHTDGELLPSFVRDFKYQVDPGRLKILFP